MIKRILAFILVLAMALGLTGCSVIDEKTAVSIANTLITNALTGGQSNVTNDGQGSSQSSEDTGLDAPLLTQAPQQQTGSVVYGGSYSTKDEVALYIHLYGELPANYITKKEAQALGWVASKGNLWKVTDHKSIGGDYFGNYEGLLPKASGRKYYECDIDYNGGTRNAKRIIYSNDALVYYTEDHYKTFTKLYGGN